MAAASTRITAKAPLAKVSTPGVFSLEGNRKWAAVGAALLLLLLGGVWIFGGESQVDRVRRLRKGLFSPEARNLSREERREKFKELGQEMSKLSPQERGQLDAEREKADADRMGKFFGKSKDEQSAELDKIIDKMEEGRKKWEEGAGKRGRRGRGKGGVDGAADGGKQGGPGAGPGGPGGGRGFGGPGAGPGGPGGGRGGPGAGPGGWGGRGKMSQEQRELRQKNRLDATSPEHRAQRTEFRRLFQDQLKQRGVSFGGRRARGGF